MNGTASNMIAANATIRYVHLSFLLFVDGKTAFRVQIYASTFATRLQR